MEVIIGLLLISLIIVLGFIFAFFWAVDNGQFEDDYTPSVRMLLDDESTKLK